MRAPRAPRPPANNGQPIPPPMTPEQMAQMRNDKIVRDIVSVLGFVVGCAGAGFMLTIGQHLAMKVLGLA